MSLLGKKKVFTLADRKTWVWKLISIYFYILISPTESDIIVICCATMWKARMGNNKNEFAKVFTKRDRIYKIQIYI